MPGFAGSRFGYRADIAQEVEKQECLQQLHRLLDQHTDDAESEQGIGYSDVTGGCMRSLAILAWHDPHAGDVQDVDRCAGATGDPRPPARSGSSTHALSCMRGQSHECRVFNAVSVISTVPRKM